MSIFFNRFLQRDVRLGDGFLKGVQVHADQVNGLDAVFLRLAHMLFIVAAVQQAPVHHGVKRLQASFTQFRFGNKLYSKLVQVQAGLVGNGYQCALNSHKIKYL